MPPVPALLLVFLAPVTQVSSNMEEDKLSVMRATGSSVVIDCDLTHNYIHWYKFQEGAVPRRLLYYDVYNSKVVLEPGTSQGKYHVYKGTGKGYTIVISNLQESDSGYRHRARIPRPRHDSLMEQVTNQRTSSRYPAASAREHLCHCTYLLPLLLVKSAAYFVIIAFCMCKRTGVSNNAKSS